MRTNSIFAIALAVGVATFASAAGASPVNGTGDLLHGVIYGSGNANGSFTGETKNNVEVGLRAHMRYDTSGQAQNIFNYDGNHTYTFDPSQFNAPANRSGWNFDWSINTNANGSGTNTIGSYSYLLSVNGPSGIYRTPFDPYDGTTSTVGYYDHAFGNNSTANGAGVSATNSTLFNTYKGQYNVSQQSWNLGFENLAPLAALHSGGLFNITLDVFNSSGATVASSNIDVNVTPIPASLPLFLSGIGLLGFFMYRRKKGTGLSGMAAA